METTENYMQICKRIRKIRKEKGLSQTECTSLLGQKSSFMSKIETGTSILTVPSLIKLAEILDCSIDSIVYGDMLSDSNAEKEQQLVDSFRRLPDDYKDSLLVYSDFCCLKAKWDEDDACEMPDCSAGYIVNDKKSGDSEKEQQFVDAFHKLPDDCKNIVLGILQILQP